LTTLVYVYTLRTLYTNTRDSGTHLIALIKSIHTHANQISQHSLQKYARQEYHAVNQKVVCKLKVIKPYNIVILVSFITTLINLTPQRTLI
jgi:hypothetical protein